MRKRRKGVGKRSRCLRIGNPSVSNRRASESLSKRVARLDRVKVQGVEYVDFDQYDNVYNIEQFIFKV